MYASGVRFDAIGEQQCKPCFAIAFPSDGQGLDQSGGIWT
jgi:hypothetical protein